MRHGKDCCFIYNFLDLECWRIGYTGLSIFIFKMLNNKSFCKSLEFKIQTLIVLYSSDKRYLKHRLKFQIYRNRYLLIIAVLTVALYIFYIFGLLERTFLEIEYNEDIIYALPSENLRYFVEAEKLNASPQSAKSYRVNNFSYAYNHSPSYKCEAVAPTLLIIVRTAPCNFEARSAIRETWGNESQLDEVTIARAFMLGQCGSMQCRTSAKLTKLTLSATTRQ